MPNCDKRGFFRKKQVSLDELQNVTEIISTRPVVAKNDVCVCSVGAVLVVSRKAAWQVLVCGSERHAGVLEHQAEGRPELLESTKPGLRAEEADASVPT